MFRLTFLAGLVTLAIPTWADDLPAAISCYQTATNSQDIEAYLACFTDDAVMIDVNREFVGHDAIRVWAEREVMPGGQSFKHLQILEYKDGYAKTEVNWASLVLHYHYLWNGEGKITKMSLKYAD